MACGRCCSICHKFCGIKIECHHIIQESNGGQNTTDNCIPLCFDCHADMLAYDPKHPKGTKYSPEELKMHRNNWFAKVSNATPSNYTQEHLKMDQDLFNRIISTLPWKGSISFIRDNNFAGFSFENCKLRDLEIFDSQNENPSWEFIDPRLEVIRATLAQSVSHFLNSIATNTFSTNHQDRNSVPEEWEYEQPDRFIDVVKDLHDTAQAIVNGYTSLVGEGRRRLAIEVQQNDGEK